MKKYFVVTPIIALLLIFNMAHADRTVWYVHPDSALNSIQAGLDSCANNDIVLVGPGTYYENIVWPNTQGIHLVSELGPEATIIDGDSTERVITINNIVDTMTIIMGFTIQNGIASGPGGGLSCNGSSPTISNNIIRSNSCAAYNPGGGIFCGNNSTAIIRNNIIEDNVAYYAGGGGIRCFGSSPIITGNTITRNGSFGGGGINCDASSPLIAYNTITLNEAWWFTVGGMGGGISCVNNSSPIIRHNTIAMNIASVVRGGGGLVCASGSSPIIDSCTFSDNTGCGITARDGTVPLIFHCDITGNSPNGVHNYNSTVTVVAEYNWWGDSTGPYHPDSNPGGQGDTVSDYVDFIPWLDQPVGVWEQPIVTPVNKPLPIGATIFRGPLQLPKDKACKVFDITGREVKPHLLAPGIYFIEVDGVVTQKVIKVR